MFFESYTSQIVFSGNVIQVFDYERPIRYGFAESSDFLSFSASSSSLLVQSVTSQESDPPPEGMESLAALGLTDKEKEEKKASLGRRAKARFARKVSSNFGLYTERQQQASGRWLKFLTLTYKRNVQDWQEAHSLFAAFIGRLSYHSGQIEYACVPEKQKRGAWHFHLIIRSDFIQKGVMRKVWSDRPECGSWNLKKIDEVENVGGYISKYMQKTFDVDKSAKQKRFFTSKGLQDVSVVFRASRETMDWLAPFGSRRPSRESEYEGDWVGKVRFREFVLPNTSAAEIAALQREILRYANQS